MKKFNLFALPALLVLAFSFGGCEQKVTTELKEVHWDRDMCGRCTMVVSERKFAVQVINPETGKSRMFDDIGCTVLWFAEERIPWADKAKIWITDAETGEWIDARNAFYDTDSLTPMGFGFGAHKAKSGIQEDEEVISYDEVQKRLMKKGTGH